MARVEHIPLDKIRCHIGDINIDVNPKIFEEDVFIPTRSDFKIIKTEETMFLYDILLIKIWMLFDRKLIGKKYFLHIASEYVSVLAFVYEVLKTLNRTHKISGSGDLVYERSEFSHTYTAYTKAEEYNKEALFSKLCDNISTIRNTYIRNKRVMFDVVS